MRDQKFIRTEMIIGGSSLEKLQNSKVAIFGIGGVGSFAAESLARSGVGSLVLIDFDEISVSNINRQIHATVDTVGRLKVEVMKERLLSINPDIEVETHSEVYNSEKNDIITDDLDYIIDAIDMVSSKLSLIEVAKSRGIDIISAMGAGNKLNPTMLEVEDIYKTSVCPLAKVMRKELRNRKIKNLKVVYSREVPISPEDLEEKSEGQINTKRQTPGSVSFVPSVSGLIISSEVIKDIIGKS